mmetsp:Transcript_1860/g.3342  ORF Transcript_1860/g.3342 Transcript_1860/m.3342 type:complete len:732 (+) Transcript_1860:615-2810(+)
MELAGINSTDRRSSRAVIKLSDLLGGGFEIPDVNAGFSFEYIFTDETRMVIHSCQDVCERILSKNLPNIQELNIPLIKGASGCGKTRLGREIAVNIIAKARGKDNDHKAVHILRRMDLFPALHSQSFINTRTGNVDGEAMLLTNLVCLSEAVPDALRYPRRPDIHFDLNAFLEHAQTVWGIDLILFQIDEYRRDLDGATAMLDTCAKRIIANPHGAKVYPIITGMTSYVEVYDDAIGRSSAISEYPGIFTHHLGTIQGPYRTAMELTLLHYIAQDTHVPLDTVAASENVWWSQLMHDIGGHARYYKFVADGVKAMHIQDEVVSGVVTGEDCGNIADYVINILGNISNPANWSSLISRQLSTNGGIDAECDVGEVADSAMRRFIALAITKQRIKAYRQWRLREVDGYNTNMSLKIATHSGLIGFYTYPGAREDAVVDISRLMIAALNNHSGAMQSWALTNSTEMSADNAAAVESFRMRLCAGLTADLDEDALFIDDARPVCIAHTGTDLRLQPSAQLWDPIGHIERVDRYVFKSWPSDGSLPKSVYFTDSIYKGWCGLSYFLNYNNPSVPVIVLHLLSKPEYTVSDAMNWVKEVCQELFAWTRWPTTIEADVVVDIIFSIPDGRIVLPAQGGTATATRAPIPIRRGTGATAAAAMNNEYDDVREQQKAAIAMSLNNLQDHIRQFKYIDAFQDAIPDNRRSRLLVKTITAAIASDYFPVRDIFEQYRTGRRRR